MPNHLAREKSPYLLQHADNPVDWHPWSEEALAKARAEDKPIFLSIGYATCHWCHVMAHESFEDSEVAALLNRDFVAIKVDREERPDLDDLYMNVCQALTGQGGWPLSVFLTPEAKPFYAGTYFPKNTAMGRPGFLQVLDELARRWKSPERARMIEAAEEITKALKPAPTPGELNDKTLDQAVRLLAGSFDSRHGGFGNAPKFPSPHQFMFLLRRHVARPDSNALEMVEATLKAMRDGGIFDQVGYGFHRYSTDAQWLAPHFEKMLYDQALLAMAYLEAGLLTGKEEYSTTAEQVFAYVLGEMTHSDGGFFSAEDADSEGVEGLFYLWKPGQVEAVLGPDEARLFNDFYGIVLGGNFENNWSIPHRKQSVESFAAALGRPAHEVAEVLEASREKLLAVRAKRVRPLRDDKVLTAWNGLMIAALAMGHRMLGREEYLAAASKAADFILAEMTDQEGRLMRRWREGQVKGVGFLEDYAFMIWGLIELYLAGFDPTRLEQAISLARMALELFGDPEHGGLFLAPSHGEDLILRNKDVYDGALPSGNSTMAYNLLRLARLTGDPGLDKEARAIISGLGGMVLRHPPAFTMMLSALEFALDPGREVVLAGETEDGELHRMLEVLRRRFAPAEVVLLRPAGQAGGRVAELAPFTAEMEPPPEGARAYVCAGHACQRPVEDAAALAALLEQGS